MGVKQIRRFDLSELIVCLSKVSETLSLSILVVFCLISWTISYIFHYLNFKTGELTMKASPGSPDIVVNQLENWRRQHAFTCHLVEKTNSCFGIVLLIAITHSFVSFITDTFEITMAFKTSNSLQTHFIIRFVQHFFLLSLVCLGSSCIQSEVRKFKSILMLLNN